MTWLPRLTRLLRNLFRKTRVERDLDAELDSYVGALEQEKIAAGQSPAAARRDALVELGGLEPVKEQVRDVRAGAGLDRLGQDVRYGLRALRRSPGFTVSAVLTLALGIGVSTAIFGVVDTVLFRPLPYLDAERLAMIYEGDQGATATAWTEFDVYAREARYLQSVAAIQPAAVTVMGDQNAEPASGALVSASLLPMLGVIPQLGRNFLPEEDRPGAAQVALLSDSLWRRRFGADPGVIGRTVALDVNESWGRRVPRSPGFTVVGVLPASFSTLVPGIQGDVWLPLAPAPRNGHDLLVIGQLKAGVTAAQVKADLEAITAPLRDAVHSDRREMRVRVVPLLDALLGDWRQALLVLLAAVAFVLLMACVNVANLLLARGRARRRELSVRVALGAGRRRLVRQLLTESLLLSLIGGVLAVLVAQGGIALLSRLSPGNLPRLPETRLDLRALAFMALLVVLAALLSGLAPALRLSRSAGYQGLKEGGRGAAESRGSRRLRGFMVVGEVALAIVLLIGSGLMMRTLVGLLRVDPGFDARNVLTFRLSLPRSTYEKVEPRVDFYQRVLQRIESLPGVEAAGVNQALPFGGFASGTFVARQGSSEQLDARWCAVNAGYFRALGIPLLRGRAFQADDFRPTLNAAIVDPILAERLWGSQDPIGQTLVLAGVPPLTVVGIVGRVRDSDLVEEARPTVYLPMYPRTGTVVVRGGVPPAVLVAAVRAALTEVDKRVAPSDVQSMEERVAGSSSVQRFTALLLGIFAGAALFLGMIGLYGVISFSVSQRTQEIGLRMALGARQGQVAGQVVGQGMRWVAVGVVLGVSGALGLTRLMSSLLFGVSPADPLTYATVPLLLALVAMLACYVPARRASRVDPAVALRHE